MEERVVKISLEQARGWYNGKNEALQKIALKAYTKEELQCNMDYKEIRTFEDACNALCYSKKDKVIIEDSLSNIRMFSNAAVAKVKLDIIRRALNLGYKLSDINNKGYYSLVYIHPNSDFLTGLIGADILGAFRISDVVYNIAGNLWKSEGENESLKCATPEIAKHFSKYFGMLMIRAQYGDLEGFRIEYSKY